MQLFLAETNVCKLGCACERGRVRQKELNGIRQQQQRREPSYHHPTAVAPMPAAVPPPPCPCTPLSVSSTLGDLLHSWKEEARQKV